MQGLEREQDRELVLVSSVVRAKLGETNLFFLHSSIVFSYPMFLLQPKSFLPTEDLPYRPGKIRIIDVISRGTTTSHPQFILQCISKPCGEQHFGWYPIGERRNSAI